MLDVLTLQRHPGWTWDDLQNMPQEMLDLEAEYLAAKGDASS